MPHWICATCGVEYPKSWQPPEGDCAICLDERQYVPRIGQRWTTWEDLAAEEHEVAVEQIEPGLNAMTRTPGVGISHCTFLAATPSGNLMWDPPGYVDDSALAQVRALGGVAAIAASHPHMFGAQVAWSHAFGDAPVWVNAADQRWLRRRDPSIRTWSDVYEPLPGVRLVQCGGHFPGSAVAHWTGADGRGVVLSADTIGGAAAPGWVSFQRSYPNNIPLSPAAVERIVRNLDPYDYDRLYTLVGGFVEVDAKAAVRRSADRHIAWATGVNDADT